MPVAAKIRVEIEALMAQRFPSALTPQPQIVRPHAATGISSLDEFLGGGLPLGAITEIIGNECSGRTTLAFSLLAQFTCQGKVCAWIDVSDTLHPTSAASAGINLKQLLWIRCGGANSLRPEQHTNEPLSVQPPQTTRVQLGGNSPHPRNESNGLPAAINELLSSNKHRQYRNTGTPGAPNRSLSSIKSSTTKCSISNEQVASDRQPPRRGIYVLEQREAYEPRCYEPIRKSRPPGKSYEPLVLTTRDSLATLSSLSNPIKPWLRLDQALKTTDLLLQTGGFSAIVLDMGSISPEFATRVPQSTWFRYRSVAERTQSSVLVLAQHSCAKSSAGIVLRLSDAQPTQMGETVFSGLKANTRLERQRFEQKTANVATICKFPQRADVAVWRSTTPWTGQRKEHLEQ